MNEIDKDLDKIEDILKNDLIYKLSVLNDFYIDLDRATFIIYRPINGYLFEKEKSLN